MYCIHVCIGDAFALKALAKPHLCSGGVRVLDPTQLLWSYGENNIILS